MKVKIISLGVVVVLSMSIFVGCSKGEGTETSSPEASPIASSVAASPDSGGKSTEKKGNLNAILETMKEVYEKSESVSGVGSYGAFIYNFEKAYEKKDKPVNPITKEEGIDCTDQYKSELGNTEKVKKLFAATLIAISDGTKLADLDKNTVTYGCNIENKGIVMAFVFTDGFYLYEVDEKGNKVNETTYMFPVK